jgi:hypothetical protein
MNSALHVLHIYRLDFHLKGLRYLLTSKLEGVKVSSNLVLEVLLTRVLAMDLDVSSDQNHYAKTIHNTMCKHPFIPSL